jgi:hypothetical protein
MLSARAISTRSIGLNLRRRETSWIAIHKGKTAPIE